jgi:preprotein translocase subunit YajC
MITDTLDLLQAAPQPGPGGGLIQFLPMVFIFVIFYFLLIAPMRKRQKRQQQKLSQL